MKAFEVVITARRVVEEITIRISRPVDHPEPVSLAELEVMPKRIARKPRLILLPKVAA